MVLFSFAVVTMKCFFDNYTIAIVEFARAFGVFVLIRNLKSEMQFYDFYQTDLFIFSL